MENELNYLSEKLESIEQEIDYKTRELAVSEDADDRKWYSEQLECYELEREYLNNIINFVTGKLIKKRKRKSPGH